MLYLSISPLAYICQLQNRQNIRLNDKNPYIIGDLAMYLRTFIHYYKLTVLTSVHFIVSTPSQSCTLNYSLLEMSMYFSYYLIVNSVLSNELS